jgi:hypothetical protein
MKTLSSLASLAALALVTTTFAAGCGCDPGNNSNRAPVAFTPSSSAAVRTPATCGDAATFGAGDTFTLKLLGETDVAPPYTLITLKLAPNAPLDLATPLDVGVAPSASGATTAQSTNGAVQFSFAAGSNTAELDAFPLASVIVTVTSMPSADGQPLSAELRLTFEDGRVLDQAYSAPLETVPVACSP